MNEPENLLDCIREQGDAHLANEIRNLIEKLEREKKKYLDQLLDSRHKLIQQDHTVENQKTALEKTRTLLEKYERENQALRTLLREWI